MESTEWLLALIIIPRLYGGQEKYFVCYKPTDKSELAEGKQVSLLLNFISLLQIMPKRVSYMAEPGIILFLEKEAGRPLHLRYVLGNNHFLSNSVILKNSGDVTRALSLGRFLYLD